jgi:hypothetical protein
MEPEEMPNQCSWAYLQIQSQQPYGLNVLQFNHPLMQAMNINKKLPHTMNVNANR